MLRALRFIAIAAQVLFLAACATAPLDYPKQPSVAITDTADTAIARDVAERTDEHGGLSGFYPLQGGNDAFGVRLQLIENAERAIDAQYFLMKNDAAGNIFAAALLQAADRGVRVRFLLDDIFTTVDDSLLFRLNEHPQIQVRLYNPIARRGIRTLNFLGDFKRANRRMHNKSFTVDNQVTIVGGRNIADEYFEMKTDGEFLDFDVIGIGPVAADVSAQFDLFWNHSGSVPMEAFDGEAMEIVSSDTLQKYESAYRTAIESDLVQDLFDGITPMYPATADVITDDPEKLVNDIHEDQQTLVNHLSTIADDAMSEIIIVTPYFVPGDAGVAYWKNITAKGVRVIVMTNSLVSNNHTPVHSGYARYRKDMLEAGVELYEARANALAEASDESAKLTDPLTLHSKAVIIDRKLLFAGSLNMDPRSIDINSEMGIVIHSPTLANELAEEILDDLPEFTYRVEVQSNGKLQWRGSINGEESIETKEPLSTTGLRFKAWLMKIAPEQQL